VNCYFGLLLRCTAAQPPFAVGDFMVAIRGTVTPLEWVDDGLSEIPRFGPPNIGGVGTGFWGLYTTMTFASMDGSNPQPNPAQVIVGKVRDPAGGARRLWVTGHSLGAALATYLTADIQALLAANPGIELKPYFFASPRPGTQDFADNYQSTIACYDLVNYVADLVPNVPSTPPFYTLNGGGPTHNVHIIARGLPGAPGPADPFTSIANNHSPVTYARMLDPNNATAQHLQR
jgi:hypothetical protein